MNPNKYTEKENFSMVFKGQRKIPVKNKHKRYHYVKKDGAWKPKRKFNTEAEAKAFLRNLEDKDLVAYKCPYCHKFHLGHKFDKEREDDKSEQL